MSDVRRLIPAIPSDFNTGIFPTVSDPAVRRQRTDRIRFAEEEQSRSFHDVSVEHLAGSHVMARGYFVERVQMVTENEAVY